MAGLHDTVHAMNVRRMVAVRRRSFRELVIYAVQTYGLNALAVVMAVVLVRILPVEQYGVYGAAMAWASVLGIFAHGGIVPLLVPRILAGPLSPNERRAWFVYIRRCYPFFLALAIIGVFISMQSYGIFFGICVVTAVVAGQVYHFLQVLPLPEVRERRIRAYVWIDSAAQASRTVIPVLTAAILGSVFGYFFGLAIAPIAVLVVLFGFSAWRKRMWTYLSLIMRSRAPFAAWRHLPLQGAGVMVESGAATLYASIPLFIAVQRVGWADVALLKVLIGYLTAALLLLLPYIKWISLHLPKYLRSSSDPRKVFFKYSFIGGILGCAVYAFLVAVSSFLVPLLYGSSYAPVAALIPIAGTMVIWSGFSIGLSIISKLYGLVWCYATISMINIGLGLVFIMSPLGPSTLQGFAWLHGLWLLLPCIVAMLFAYQRLGRANSHIAA